MSSWEQFICRLTNEIDWDKPSLDMLDKIGEFLIEISANPDSIVQRATQVVEYDNLFNSYAHHMEYPRPIMDKFVLFMDPADRFRVRLHKFKSQKENRGAAAWIHDHRWCFASIILSGSYREELYFIESEDNNLQKAKLRLLQEKYFQCGDINSSLPGVPHLAINDDCDEACYTLFVRGKSLYPYSKIFDLQKGSYRPSWGLRKEMATEFDLFAKALNLNN